MILFGGEILGDFSISEIRFLYAFFPRGLLWVVDFLGSGFILQFGV